MQIKFVKPGEVWQHYPKYLAKNRVGKLVHSSYCTSNNVDLEQEKF